MAVASTPLDYSLNLINNNNSKKNDNEQKKLDFYESMYHFKKMFPKFDSDVIEAILRSNEGNVDKTLDQLLSMSVDAEKLECQVVQSLIDQQPLEQVPSFNTFLHDSPPSYHEAVSKLSSSSDLNINSENLEIRLNEVKSDDLIDFSVKEIKESQTNVQSSLNSFDYSQSVKFDEPKIIGKKTSPSFIKNFNQILIGDLSKDFLRIKLTHEQVRSAKNTIKSAKRDEIAAILNNKTPKHPELSFELKKKLSILMSQLDDSDIETDFDDWEEKYKSLMKSYEGKRQQIIQDEYFAKLLQNEEFLNELRTDQDFIETLNDETSSNSKYNHNTYKKSTEIDFKRDYTVTTLSNAELLAKLSKMGKNSRIKMSKLASKFITTKKSKSLNQKCSTLNTLDFSSIEPSYTSSSTDSKEDYLVDLNSQTYDLERIKAEELTGVQNKNTISKNRYKKAYKSFKTAIKRNSSLSNHNQFSLDLNNNSQSVKNFESSKFNNSKKMSLFQDGYSYDDDNESDKFNPFDHSTYPYNKK